MEHSSTKHKPRADHGRRRSTRYDDASYDESSIDDEWSDDESSEWKEECQTEPKNTASARRQLNRDDDSIDDDSIGDEWSEWMEQSSRESTRVEDDSDDESSERKVESTTEPKPRAIRFRRSTLGSLNETARRLRSKRDANSASEIMLDSMDKDDSDDETKDDTYTCK